ncbi:MAG: hypothetical protein ACJ8C4_18470 [Gemmataceae bacterium]
MERRSPVTGLGGVRIVRQAGIRTNVALGDLPIAGRQRGSILRSGISGWPRYVNDLAIQISNLPNEGFAASFGAEVQPAFGRLPFDTILLQFCGSHQCI